MMPIGEFALVDQNGQRFGSAQLRGKVYVADFIFTSCPDICPVLSTQMSNLQRRVDSPDVRFVSITVDPEHDTPEVLRQYAARFRADHARWKFLTGEPDEVHRVVLENFRHPIGERDERNRILHGMRFLLVDRRGTMRGLYENNGEELERLTRDVTRVLEEEP